VTKQIGLLFRLYVSPLKTFSRIIDEGRLIFALLAAVAVVLALQVPRTAEYNQQTAAAYGRRLAARLPAPVRAKMRQGGDLSADEQKQLIDAINQEVAGGGSAGPPSVQLSVDRFTARVPTQYFSPLVAMAICFIPLVILALTFWDNLGGFTTILFRDYMALLVCCLLAWTAAYLPLAIVNDVLLAGHLPAYDHPALWWVAHAYFLALSVMTIRTVFGTKFAHAIGAAGGGWAGAVGGLWLHSIFGGVTAYLASPFVLYYLYMGLGPQFRSLGTGLRSRQRLKQHLETATLNPRDADAHYQLGLIYQQRRQYEPAVARFKKAIDVDPNEPDPHYQLGRIAREQGRYAEALEHLRAVARIDDKHSLSEVWREIGIAYFLAGNWEAARQALEKYLSRRPYDPEGECWYGRTLAKLGSDKEARAAFEQAIEAVRTMPPARKRQVRRWESEAKRELKKLPAVP
jgi:tetratricopeptide (TPR) repeat protein